MHRGGRWRTESRCDGGSAIAAGVAVPAVASIPYVGWLAGGWALLLGQKAGSELGSQVGTVFNDC